MSGRGSTIVLGLDEAGRGPILGPLVMACVGLTAGQARALARAGVADSKRFGAGPDAQARRRALVPRILATASHAEVVVVEVAEVDRRTLRGELNRLEQEQGAALLERAPSARRIVADGARLFAPLRARFPNLEALDHAEERHTAVAAASILAKVRRDEIFEAITARYEPEFGPLGGGGYVNPPTREFLRRYIARHGEPPPEARRSWPWDFAADLLAGVDPATAIGGRPQLALPL